LEKERLAELEVIRKKEAKAEKNRTKKERKQFRDMAKEDDFWVKDDAEQLIMMERVEFLCTAFGSARLSELNELMNESLIEDRPSIVVEHVEQYKQDEQDQNQRVTEKEKVVRAETVVVSGGWVVEDVQLLTKAMVVVPAGTLNRWEVIAVWMTEHGAAKERESKVILKKAKELEKQSQRGPMDAQAAFEKYQEGQFKKNLEGKKNTAESNEGTSNFDIDQKEWTQDEQKRLEQALRTYGPKEKDRWEKITAAVSSRTKRDCMLRFKQLAETAKAKKLASSKAKKAAN